MVMDISHETAINDLIKDVLDEGCAKVETRLLLRWFDRKNWGRGIWQSLQQRFQKELEERGEGKDGWRLYAIDANGKVSLLCFKPDDKAWWKEVSQMI